MKNNNRGLTGVCFSLALGLAAAGSLAGPAAAQGAKDVSQSYEIRVGLLAHDSGAFSSSKEDGADINGEIIFPSPDWLTWLGSPRPHIGGNIATDGISFGYVGLGWDYYLTQTFYVTGSFGGAIHDGDPLNPPRSGDRDGERYLGCRALFHLAVGLGADLTEHWTVQLYADHISNATTCESNEGLENAGIRVGYRF